MPPAPTRRSRTTQCRADGWMRCGVGTSFRISSTCSTRAWVKQHCFHSGDTSGSTYVHIYWTLHGCMAISICRYIETFFERFRYTRTHTHIYIYISSRQIYTNICLSISIYIYLWIYIYLFIYIYTWTQGCGCQRLTLGGVIAVDLSIAVYRSPLIEALYGREEPMSG